MLNGCFQAHVLFDWLMTYLLLPLGRMVLYGGFVKNAVDRLKFVKGTILYAIGSTAIVASILLSGLIMPPGCHNQRKLMAWFWRHFQKVGSYYQL